MTERNSAKSEKSQKSAKSEAMLVKAKSLIFGNGTTWLVNGRDSMLPYPPHAQPAGIKIRAVRSNKGRNVGRDVGRDVGREVGSNLGTS